MKKLLAFTALLAVVAFTSCKYDDDDIWNSVHGLENRVAKLEELCKQMNTNISSLQTIVTVLQKNDYVTCITPVMQDGKEVGYTITFSKSNPITIYHGKDGQNGEDGTDGKDGVTPTIGVKQDTDGIYYWTLDGDWLTDEHGDKIKAEGKDGADGSDGEDGSDGTDGTNGKDGITPQFKIENDYWFISYDNGDTWTQLGKATGEDGKDGEDGISGDSMFTDVDYKTSTDYVIFTLADGTQIKLPTWSAFEVLQRLCNETNTNLSALQTIVTALQNNDYITSVDPLTENGKVVGYTIKFAKSNPIVIYNGKDGADGVDGNTPVIGVKKDTDDIYYWTLDGEFIIVDGQKIKAQGADGNNGVDGSDGVTPKLEIREGYWWISYDNGANWTQLGKATGEDGKDADSIKITQDENNVYFELADGTVITISKTGQSVDPNIIQFADENVKKLCVGMWDTNGDLELSYDEAAAVTTLGTAFKGNKEIQLFNELQYFTGLKSIEDWVFSSCTNLKSLILPANIQSIGRYSFYDCGLISINIPASVVSIGDNAFYSNDYLKTAIFEGTPEMIAEAIFGACPILQQIDAPFTSNDKRTLIKDNILIACASFGITQYEIPDGVIRIGERVFTSARNLQAVHIPNTVVSIGYDAFKDCINLDGVILPNSLQIISQEAFRGAGLTSIIIPSSITQIGAYAFDDILSLNKISGKYATEDNRCLIVNQKLIAFASANLTEYTFPNNITYIECLVNWQDGNITIPDNIKEIRYLSFRDMKSITCLSTIPPIINRGVSFGSHETDNCIVYVPKGFINTYKTADGWSEFPDLKIVEF